MIFAADSRISSTLFLSVADVNITDTQGKNSTFDFRYSIYLFIIFSLSTPGLANTLSHLLTTITNHLFSSNALLIIVKSQ
ncbi:MAG: hypothetical protein Q8M44_00145 [bacterium]|nr:hypothetical protein [bacterium]